MCTTMSGVTLKRVVEREVNTEIQKGVRNVLLSISSGGLSVNHKANLPIKVFPTYHVFRYYNSLFIDSISQYTQYTIMTHKHLSHYVGENK